MSSTQNPFAESAKKTEQQAKKNESIATDKDTKAVTPASEPTINVNFKLPVSARQKLKIYAASKNVTASSLILDYINSLEIKTDIK